VDILGGTQNPELEVASFDGEDYVPKLRCKSYERAALYQLATFELRDLLRARRCVHNAAGPLQY
jgi:hypothetical protein